MGRFHVTQCCRMSVCAYISAVWNHSQVFTVIQYHLLSLQAPFLYPYLFSLGLSLHCSKYQGSVESPNCGSEEPNPLWTKPQRDSELIYLFNMNLSNMFLWKLWEVIFSNPLWDAPRCGPRCVHDINSSNSRNTVAASLSRSLWTTKAEEKSKSSELRTDHRR